MANKQILEVKDLETVFRLTNSTIHAVNGVTFSIERGDTLGVVGESGSGKSVTALSVTRLIAKPYGHIVKGSIELHTPLETIDILAIPPKEMGTVRGNQISMIFQDPMTSLNPVLTVGYQLKEPLKAHRDMKGPEATDYAEALLDRVGIPEARTRMKEYPHQFSGGMRQRVMIAIAIACDPLLLIADEPTTALDVTIQAQVLSLMNELKDERNTSIMFITHDLGVIAEMADHVAVMYGGTIMESASVKDIFQHPQNPYTQALLHSIPGMKNWPRRLETLDGIPPTLDHELIGCPFAPRCKYATPQCETEKPKLKPISDTHSCACWVVESKGDGNG